MNVILKPIPYPQEIEAWWVEQTQKRFNRRDEASAMKKLAPFADELSKWFTSHRPDDFSNCYESRNHQLAYGINFFPQTYVRTGFPIQEIVRLKNWTPPNGKDLRILDLGSGAGAAGMAAALTLKGFFPDHNCRLTLVDDQLPLLHLADNLNREALASHKIHLDFHKADLRKIISWRKPVSRKWDLVVASFSLNEAFSAESKEEQLLWLENVMRCLSPGGLLALFEPALKSTSENLEQLRDSILGKEDFHIWGPCLHSKKCPLLNKGKYWCHEVRRWTLPKSLQRLNNHLRRTPEDLKFSFLVLGNQPAPAQVQSAGHFRLIAPVAETRGKLLTSGCNALGEAGEYDLLNRNVDRITLRNLSKIERGTLIAASEPESLKHPGSYRLQDMPPLDPKG